MSKLYKCSICNKKKQHTEFYHHKSGRQKDRPSDYRCKLCLSIIKKEEYWVDVDKAKENQKRRIVNNPDKYRDHWKKYRENNLEKCRERSNKSSKEYYKRFPEALQAKGARYRARKHQAYPSWLSKEDDSKIKSIYKMCKSISEKTRIEHHVDHIIPLKHDLCCGLHVPWNLQIITKQDNLIKSNKLIEDIV